MARRLHSISVMQPLERPRTEPQAGPADAAGNQGSFNRPVESEQMSQTDEHVQGPPTNQDTNPPRHSNASWWVVVMLVLAAVLILYLFAYPY